MPRYLSLSIAAVALALAACAESRAEITYDLAFRRPGDLATFDQTIFLQPGESITGVELVLIETTSGGTESVLGDDSVFVGAGGFNERAGNLSSYRANLSASGSDGSFANLVPNGTGGSTVASDSNTTAYLALGGFFGQPGIEATAIGADTYQVVLGIVDLTGPTSGETTFTLSDFSGASDFTTFDTGSLEMAAVNSGGSFTGRSLTVAVVPEPSPLAMLVFVGGAAAICCRTHRMGSWSWASPERRGRLGTRTETLGTGFTGFDEVDNSRWLQMPTTEHQ